jgi:hypothetical protein
MIKNEKETTFQILEHMKFFYLGCIKLYLEFRTINNIRFNGSQNKEKNIFELFAQENICYSVKLYSCNLSLFGTSFLYGIKFCFFYTCPYMNLLWVRNFIKKLQKSYFN